MCVKTDYESSSKWSYSEDGLYSVSTSGYPKLPKSTFDIHIPHPNKTIPCEPLPDSYCNIVKCSHSHSHSPGFGDSLTSGDMSLFSIYVPCFDMVYDGVTNKMYSSLNTLYQAGLKRSRD